MKSKDEKCNDAIKNVEDYMNKKTCPGFQLKSITVRDLRRMIKWKEDIRHRQARQLLSKISDTTMQ